MINELTDFTSTENLINGFYKVRKVSGWKAATQKFELNLLLEISKLQKELRSGTYEQSPENIFTHNESGHIRLIKSLSVRDMVVQQSLCNSVLIPVMRPHLIYDNGASLTGKGLSFTRKRVDQHLKWHYRRYGIDGYILKIDFKKYFDNIDHDVVREILYPYIQDYPYAISTLDKILKANRVDISSYEFSEDEAFSSLDYNNLYRYNLLELSGTRYLNRSLGIGSPVSQLIGLVIPMRIDHYCKTIKRIHCYDAYMDDRIAIHPSKDYLKDLLGEVSEIAESLKIFIHPNKTQIIKLSHGFTFLKTKYIITESGKIIHKIPRDVVTRQRCKMKKLVKSGIFDNEKLTMHYNCWKSDKIKNYNANYTLYNLDKEYWRLAEWITMKSES